jgi:ribosomal protein L11 methyltransferase
MRWVSLSVEVDALWAEGLADALLEHGALCVEVTDADVDTTREAPLFSETGNSAGMVWPLNTLSALFDVGVDPSQALAAACHAVEAPIPAELRIESVPEQDWVRMSQQQFGPIQISSRLWIVPTWCRPPVPGTLVLKVDPGLAFGTGAHPSTWQCLQWLDEHLLPGQSVLDYGCGSGILSIAAKKLGAGRVVATDTDPEALMVSARNALANGVALDILAPEALPNQRFDVVVANILANPLRLLAPLLSNYTCAAGHIVLAGILDAQGVAVGAAYAEWFDPVQSYSREGWTCLAGRRRLAP